MIPLMVDVPMKRVPWANWLLILVTVIVSLAVPYKTPGEWTEIRGPGTATIMVPTPARLSPLVLGGPGNAAYQVFTALFQHADWVHLFGNMLFLFVFGNPINAKLGHVGYLGAYLGIGAAENALWIGLSPGVPCLGASAAIMGICGMFLVLYPRNSVEFLWDDARVLMLFRTWRGELPGWAVVLLFVAFDIYGAAFDTTSRVAHGGHLIGLVLGAGLAVFLLRAGWLRPDRGEQNLLQWLSGQPPARSSPPRRRRKQPAIDSAPPVQNSP